jgi:hypothetical protein
MAHTEEDFREILNAESFVDREALAAAAKDGVPAAVRAEAWKYLLSVSKPDRSQELSAERDRKNQDYLRQDKHNVDILQRVRGELRRSTVRRDARDPERGALLSSADNLKIFENITVAFLNGNEHVDYHDGLVHMLCPFMSCGLSDEAGLFHCFQSLMQRMEQKLRGAGIRQYAAKFITLFRELLPELHEHFEVEELGFEAWCIPWLRFLLSKELPLPAVVRLWDTYFALFFDTQQSDASIDALLDFHMYACLAVLEPLQEEISQLERGEIKGVLSRLPAMDMDEVITKASYMQQEINQRGLF